MPKPVSVFRAMGHVVACTTAIIIESGAKPNQIITRGKRATPGSGLKIAESTSTKV